jgi:hypothetical protein
MGGVYNTINAHLYHYAGNNPVKYTDPDGEALFIPLIILATATVAVLMSDKNSSSSSKSTSLTSAPTSTATSPEPTETNSNRGVPVHAIRSGTVFRSGWQNENDHSVGMGWRTSVNTGDGYYDQYGHLDPNSTLPANTAVNAGDEIGRMADPTNGHSTGPHVHIERRQNDGSTVDPGNNSPFIGRSRITSRYQNQEPGLRDYPHTGADHVPEN